MTNTTSPRTTAADAPAAPTDAELLAAIQRGIAAGTLIEVNDEYLARLAAEAGIDRCAVCSGPYAEHDTPEGRCCAECAGLED